MPEAPITNQLLYRLSYVGTRAEPGELRPIRTASPTTCPRQEPDADGRFARDRGTGNGNVGSAQDRAPVQVRRSPRQLAAIRAQVAELAIPEPNTGCWLWLGTLNSQGYGRAWLSEQKARTAAHRASYEAFVGKIPVGLQIDHRCRVRCCVNPAHLEPVTAQVNTLRSASVVALNARKERCSRGHDLAGDNLHIGTDGHRRCRECTALKSREHYERNREKVIARTRAQKLSAARRAGLKVHGGGGR